MSTAEDLIYLEEEIEAYEKLFDFLEVDNFDEALREIHQCRKHKNKLQEINKIIEDNSKTDLDKMKYIKEILS